MNKIVKVRVTWINYNDGGRKMPPVAIKKSIGIKKSVIIQQANPDIYIYQDGEV